MIGAGCIPYVRAHALTVSCPLRASNATRALHSALERFRCVDMRFLLTSSAITSKAISHQVAKPHFTDCARTMTGLRFAKGPPFTEFRPSVMQDGRACAIHDGLREVLPGRLKVVKPTAVERHTTMDLLCDAPTTVVVTPDTPSEQAFVPEPAALRARGLWAARGYVDLPDLHRVQDEGGFLLIRAKAGMQPPIIQAFREDGQRLRALRNKPLQALHATLPKRQRVERVGPWQGDTRPLCLRLFISGNRQTQAFCSVSTHLPAQRSHLDTICRAYTGRWPVEWRWKAWQSYATLPAFDTANPAIVEGLIWTAIAAAALTRFWTPRTPLLVAVPIFTRRVAMDAVHVRGGIVRALEDSGDVGGLDDALEAAMTYLACHPQRAHPKRDRQTGRSQLGLEPCCEHDNVIELAEAA